MMCVLVMLMLVVLDMIIGDLLFNFSVMGIRFLDVVCIICLVIDVVLVNNMWLKGSFEKVVFIFGLLVIIVILFLL